MRVREDRPGRVEERDRLVIRKALVSERAAERRHINLVGVHIHIKRRSLPVCVAKDLLASDARFCRHGDVAVVDLSSTIDGDLSRDRGKIADVVILVEKADVAEVRALQ